jgi:hypothetical protein
VTGFNAAVTTVDDTAMITLAGDLDVANASRARRPPGSDLGVPQGGLRVVFHKNRDKVADELLVEVVILPVNDLGPARAGFEPSPNGSRSAKPLGQLPGTSRSILGTFPAVTEHPEPDRIEHRAQLLPEEAKAGSDDPETQARLILEDSDERTEHPEQTRRDSTQTPD